MTLKTGNKNSGFTLTEVMIACAVVSLSLLLVHEIFFKLLDRVNYCSNYLRSSWWIDDKVWRAQDELKRLNSLSEPAPSGEIILDGKKFNWSLSYVLLSSSQPPLYRIDSVIAWREGGKDVSLSRTACAIYDKEE